MSLNENNCSNERPERLLESVRPPEKTVSLSSFTTGEYTVDGIANGAEQAYDGTDGAVLNVHPVKNAAGDNYLMPLFAGGRNMCRFDKVIFADSTVDMAKITLFVE